MLLIGSVEADVAEQFSFDVVSEVNMQELKNALDQATKEIKQRFGVCVVVAQCMRGSAALFTRARAGWAGSAGATGAGIGGGGVGSS